MPNFSDILSRKSADAKMPIPLPVGSYVWLIEGQPRFDKSSKQQTDFVEFSCRCLQAQEDVDQNALQEAGGCVGKIKRLTFYLTDDAEYRIHNAEKTGFLDHLGISDPGLSLGEKISMAPGRQFIGYIRHRPGQTQSGEQRIFDEIGQTAAL